MTHENGKASEKGAFAALDELIATVILLVAKSLNFVVVLVVRLTGAVSGAPNTGAAAVLVAVPGPAQSAAPQATVAAASTPAAAMTERASPGGRLPAESPDASQSPAGFGAVATAPRRTLAGPATTTPAAPMAAQAPTHRTRAVARPAGSEGGQEERCYRGYIAWHGTRHFTPAGRDPYDAYALQIRCTSGDEQILQGVELEAAIRAAGVDIGDRIEVRLDAKEYVGTFAGRKRFRNKWAVTRQ